MAQSRSNSKRVEGIRSFSQLANDIAHAPDEYQYFKMNETFANSYVEDFVNGLLENEFIPDILMEVLGEMTDKNKMNMLKHHENTQLQSDLFIRNTNSGNKVFHANEIKYDGSDLLSDNILNSLRMTNNYPVNESTYKYVPKQYNNNSIENYYQSSASHRNKEPDYFGIQNYQKKISGNPGNNNNNQFFHRPEPFSSKITRSENNTRKASQPLAQSINMFHFDTPRKHSLKKHHSTKDKIRAEIAQNQNNVSSTQNELAEELIGTTLQSDILTKLVNETLEEERRKKAQEKSKSILNGNDNFEY